MESVLPLIVAVMYAATGVLHYRAGDSDSCGLWMCYAAANVFLVRMSQK